MGEKEGWLGAAFRGHERFQKEPGAVGMSLTTWAYFSGGALWEISVAAMVGFGRREMRAIGQHFEHPRSGSALDLEDSSSCLRICYIFPCGF